MKVWRAVAAAVVVACADLAAPAMRSLEVRILTPARGAVIPGADSVLFLGDATGSDVGLVPDDSVWWTIGAVTRARGRIWRTQLPPGLIQVGFHARYGPRADSVSVVVAVRGNGVGDVRWVVPLDTNRESGLSQALDGTLYTTNRGFSEAVAIRSDGTVLWRSQLPVLAYRMQPAIGGDGTLYWPHWGGMGSRGGVLAMGSDGSVRWNFACDAYGPAHSNFYHVHGHAAIGTDGTIFIASEENDAPIYAINPDGSLRWRTGTRTTQTGIVRFAGPVTLVGDSLVVSLRHDLGSIRVQLVAVAIDSGALRWSRDFGLNPAPAAVAVGTGGTVYAAGAGSVVYGEAALGAFTPAGDTMWVRSYDFAMNAGGVTVANGRVLVPGDSGGLVLYDATNGDSLAVWGTPPGRVRGGAATIGRNGVVYLLGQDSLYSYAADGQRRFAVHVPNRLRLEFAALGGAVIGADGTVYVRASDLGVVAIRDTVGPALTAEWPTFQGNFQRQGRN